MDLDGVLMRRQYESLAIQVVEVEDGALQQRQQGDAGGVFVVLILLDAFFTAHGGDEVQVLLRLSSPGGQEGMAYLVVRLFGLAGERQAREVAFRDDVGPVLPARIQQVVPDIDVRRECQEDLEVEGRQVRDRE